MLLGAAYYPEHRDPLKWDFDLDRMAEAHVNCLRVGEFAWVRFEPKPGIFDFSWMDIFNEKAERRGIKLLMCPPLRTTPAWLVEEDPSVLIEREDGVRLEFGSRYTFCINHPLLRERGAILAETLAKHYAGNPNIVGWHLDNEHGDEPDCHCPICRQKFQRWCQQQYGTIEALNEKWGLVFWGLEFNSFSQVPTPRVSKTFHSPGHLQAWRRFRSECTIEGVHLQADAIRKFCPPAQFITTNNQPSWNPRTDYYEMDQLLDIAGTNYYPDYGDGSWFLPFALSSCRSFKRKGFQVHELRNGAHMIPGRGGNTPAPGEVERLTLHAVGNGADAIFYFRWRACPFGAEQSHGTLTDYDGRPKRVYFEVQRTFERLTRLEDKLKGTQVVSEVAQVHDFPTWWAADTGVTWNGPRGWYLEYNKRMFQALKHAQVNVDVTSIQQDLSAYKVVVVPLMTLIDDSAANRLLRYVEEGGTLVWHPLCGTKDPEARIYPDRLHPALVNLMGVNLAEFATLGEGERVPFTWRAKEYQASLFCDLLSLQGAEVEGEFTGGWFNGLPALTRRLYGKGQVFYVAGFAEMDFYRDFIRWLCAETGVPSALPSRQPDCIEVTERRSPAGRRLVFLHNTSNQEQTLDLPSAHDVYHSEPVTGKTTIDPFGVRVLEI